MLRKKSKITKYWRHTVIIDLKQLGKDVNFLQLAPVIFL